MYESESSLKVKIIVRLPSCEDIQNQANLIGS